MYKTGIKQVQSRKVSSMNVNDLEENMVSLYHLMYFDEGSDEEDEDIKEHALVVQNNGKVK